MNIKQKFFFDEILCIYIILYAIWGMARLKINLWRSWQAAISFGEEHASFEPEITEWDSYYPLSDNDPHCGLGTCWIETS